MERAVNPKTGEVLFLVNDQWVKPTQTAINPKTGENAFLVNNEWQMMPMPKAAPTERTLGEALVTDPLTSLLSGTGTMLSSPGQLKKLITGEKPTEEKPKGTIESLAESLLPLGVDLKNIPEKLLEKLTPTAPTLEGVTGAVTSPFQKLQPIGEELQKFGEKQKSTGLQAREKERELAIQQAEGFLPEAGAAVWGTLKDPALLSNFIFEQIPNFAGTLGGGAISKQMVKGFFKDATEKTLGKVGVGGAVATGGAMQAGDIGAETYEMINNRLIKEGTPPDQAHLIALEKARMAAAQAGAISIASSFIPGGKALERRFLTEAGKKAGFPGFIPGVGNILGETVQEGTEEGGGKLVSNIQAAQVFPDIDVMKGVGAATGLGALGGGVFGGLSNLPSMAARTPEGAPAPTVPPTAGAPTVPPGAIPPAAPAIPLEAQLEETPAAIRLVELQNALQEVDKAFKTPDLTPDDFRNLNNLAAQLRTQIAKVQSGEPAPIPTAPKAEEPITPPVEAPVEAAIQSPVAPTVTPVTPTAETPVQAVQEPIQAPQVEVPIPQTAKPIEAAAPAIDLKSEQAYRMKYAVEAIDKGETKLTPRNVNPLAKELGIKPGITPDETLANVKQALGIEAALVSVAPQAEEVVEEPPETLDSTNPENIKKTETISAKYQNNEDVSREESDFHLAVMRDVMSKEEKLKSPPISKKSVIPIASIEVAPFNNGYVSSFSYNEFTKGLGIGTPLDISTIYPTRQEAIDAVAKEVRDRAEKDGNKVALKWLDTVSTPVTLVPQKTKAEINKARQAEKKAAATEVNEEKLVDAIQSMAYEKGRPAKNTANDFIAKYGKKMFDDAVKADLLDNEPGEGRLFPSNKYAYEVAPKYFDTKGKKIKAAKEEKIEANKARQAEEKVTKEVKPVEAEETLRVSSPTESGLADSLSKYLGGSTIRIDGENVYNAKGLIPYYKVRKEGNRYKLYETSEVKPVEAKKPSTAVVPKVDEEWAEFKQELTAKPSSMDQDVWDKYQDFQKGNLGFSKASFTGANALAKENAANKSAKIIYDKAAREFLGHAISLKPPTKNAPKLEISDNVLVAVPPPIVKNIKPVKTLEDQKKAILSIASPKDEKRKMLQGVLVEPKKLVVTDGHRLAMYQTNTGVSENVLLGKDGKVIDMQYAPYEKIVEKAIGAKPIGTVNAIALGNYARGTRNAWKYISAEKDSPFGIQIVDQIVGFNGRYIEDMANMFRQFGYDGFDVSFDDRGGGGGMLVATSPDGKLTQYVMSMRRDNTFMPYNLERNVPGLYKNEEKPSPDEGTFYNNFDPDFTEADFDHSKDDVRKEKIKELASESRRITKSVKKIADMGSDIATQYELNRALNAKKALIEEIEAKKQPKTLPEDIMAKAGQDRAEFVRTGGLDGLSPEAYAVLEALYKKQPYILNGLKLSVRATERPGVTGSFDPMERLVTVYKKGISAIFGGAGEKQAKTMRHEIAHSLEQMMNSDVKSVLVNAWANSLQKAIKKHEGDQVYQDYFNAVLDFIEKPNEDTYRKATNLMPEYSMYQYINPSEYWAVNAEPLLNAQLGGAWTRFTKAVKGLWEAIKSVFGFDNRYAVHREFNRIKSGDQQRINKNMLVDYLDQSGVSRKFINNIEKETDLIDDLNLPEVPEHEEQSMKDMAVAGYRKMQELGKEFGENPGKTATKSLISAADKATQFRIENVWFAAGLDKRDQSRYGGQIRAADGLMAASIAIKNAIHSAHVATRVITQGGLEFSQKFGQFVAVKSATSMGNVVKLQYQMKKKLGNKVALQIINAFFIAKRSRSIQNEFLNASAALQQAQESGDFAAIADAQADYNSIKTAYGKIPKYFRALDEDGKPTYETIYDDNGEAVDRIPILNDEAIDRAIDMGKLHPELNEMMKNWTAVNHNMLDMLAFSGRISKKGAEKLKSIKDYVPWYRIMDDQEDIHDGKLMSNYPGGPRRFKAGETDRDIDNVVESMIHNVVMMTRSAAKTHAINRVISEYGQRYEEGPKKGKLMVFPSEGRDAEGTRIASFIGGRRVITNIPDNMVADAVLGLIAAPFTFPLQKVLSAASNGFRRAITFTPWFQVKQAFIDAPTAAWVSGVRNPFKLWASCFDGFVRALKVSDEDPIVQILRNAGIGGYQSFHRSAKKEREIELGLLERSNYAAFLNAVDHVGDASDLSQRVAVYKRVLAEKGDPALALLQASDIIDFQKHGKGRLAQVMRTTVTFMQAYATQLDALAQASIGGNLKGKPRKEAQKQFLKTGMLLASTTLMYAFLAGADDDYWELDDQTRLRNFYIPGSKKATGHHILIPMATSASFFFKAVPELLYSKIVSEGTKNEMDARRVSKALGQAAMDALLGPNPVPTGAKPVIEIAFNHDFFTGGNVVPKGLEGLDAAEQYNANTSELGHAISKLTSVPGTDDKRLLNPIQADHLMRGMGGSIATLGMYFSNLAFGDTRPAADLKQNPVIGQFVGPEVSRKNEELFYDLKEVATGKYKTYQAMLDSDKFDDADKFYDKNQGIIDAYEYVSSMDTDLKELNKEIRRIGKSVDKDLTPKAKAQEINELKRLKSDILDEVTEFRKEAGF